MICRAASVSFFLVAAFIAFGNDGPLLAVPAGSIQFTKTDIISMDKEDLFIGEDKIRVQYVFKNTSDKDFKTDIGFPLPIYALDEFEGEKPNYTEFSVKVNGKSLKYKTVVRGVLCEKPAKEWTAPERGQFKPIKDVTDVLTKYGMEIGDPEKVYEQLDHLKPETEKELIKAGVLERDGEVTRPLWYVQTTYVWEQVFPAGAETKVEHEYAPQAGYFNETHLSPFYEQVYSDKLDFDKVPKFGTPEFNSQCGDFLKRYDIDETILKWAEKQLAAKRRFGFTVVDYVLTTAAYWKGPIKDFTLTVEKPIGEAKEPIVVTAAIPGLKKIDDRHFQLKKTDFTPDKDLSIVYIHAYEEI